MRPVVKTTYYTPDVRHAVEAAFAVGSHPPLFLRFMCVNPINFFSHPTPLGHNDFHCWPSCFARVVILLSELC